MVAKRKVIIEFFIKAGADESMRRWQLIQQIVELPFLLLKEKFQSATIPTRNDKWVITTLGLDSTNHLNIEYITPTGTIFSTKFIFVGTDIRRTIEGPTLSKLEKVYEGLESFMDYFLKDKRIGDDIQLLLELGKSIKMMH